MYLLRGVFVVASSVYDRMFFVPVLKERHCLSPQHCSSHSMHSNLHIPLFSYLLFMCNSSGKHLCMAVHTTSNGTSRKAELCVYTHTLLSICFPLVSCSAYCSTPKMESSFSETSSDLRQDYTVWCPRRQNSYECYFVELKSHYLGVTLQLHPRTVRA